MKKLLSWYFGVSLIGRIIACLIAGAVIGGALWLASDQAETDVWLKSLDFIEPFGKVFISMLKMIVIPVVFFSLLCGASSLPVSKFGRVGLKTIGWYLLCSLFAAVVGACLALLINPGAGAGLEMWEDMASEVTSKAADLETPAETEGTLVAMLYNMFTNPFKALANDNFLPIIVFSIMFGLAIRVLIETATSKQQTDRLEMLIGFFEACRDAMFKLVDWILEYSPIGVLALTIVNFAKYGPKIVGPYVSVTLGVVCGILVMVFCVYPALLLAVTRQNPFKVLKQIREAMIMAFVSRSSAATLPVSIKVAEEELKIHNELASFSLPLGATINMDGVCVHLPMFAVLAANMFSIELTLSGLAVLVITTVLASIGAGGVPGGSIMLLFIILQTMGLTDQQVATVVALAFGINPILDMFETMNNVTGDLVCTYTVAHNENLIGPTDSAKIS
jgi:proton glutamate symport protein